MKILVVDDHALIRRGIISLLRENLPNPEFGEAASSREGFDEVLKQPWDLAIVDVSMPGRSGLELLRDIRSLKPTMPVLVVSAHAERDYAIRALKLGAAGYVSKEVASDVLVAAVKRVLSGGRYVSPSVAELMAGSLSGATSETTHETLSNRELQVLKLIASGKSLKEIGDELALSEKTVATYRSRIGEKMGIQSNVDLTRYAMRHGLVE
jgi:two-component system, NarL family, invasion response regulator UvrY